METRALKKHRAISTFLVVGISLIFSMASAYSDYNDLIEVDFFTRGVKYEAADIDDLLVDKQINLDFIQAEFSAIGSLEIDLHGLLIVSSFQVVSIDPPLSVLRC